MDPLIDATLTDTPTDNQGTIDVRNSAQLMLYMDYTKGDELGADIYVEFTVEGDTTLFFPMTYQASLTSGLVKEAKFRLEATGKYRIPVPSTSKEWVARVSVSADTPGGAPGTLKVYALNAIARGAF